VGLLRGVKTTATQRRMLSTLYLHTGGDRERWYRAGDSGLRSSHAERVTLASLHTHGFVERQVWTGAGGTSPAHEYRLTQDMYEACQRAEARVAARKGATA
jgi:hypothetical protein